MIVAKAGAQAIERSNLDSAGIAASVLKGVASVAQKAFGFVQTPTCTCVPRPPFLYQNLARFRLNPNVAHCLEPHPQTVQP
jgi:hypothetical protein